MVLHLFRSLATKKEQTHHWGVSALLRQNVNCTEVFILLLSIVQLSVYAIRTAWQEETVLRTKMALAALQCLVVVYRYADIVLAYPTFFKRSEENSQHCVRVTIPASFVSCTFSQRVFAEIHTFSSEFLVEPYVFLWMSLLREIFCTTFSKTSHAVDTTQARANCVQNENSETHALWIATSRCNPNNSKLREQYSPRSLFDVTF